MKIFTVKILIFLFGITGYSAAQTTLTVSEEDSLYQNNILITDLNNNANSASLFSRINYTLSLEKIELSLHNKYSSNVSKLEKNFFRDINDVDFVVNYKLLKSFYAGGGITAVNLSDDKNVELNENDNNFFFANFVYLPRPEITLTSRLGYKNENQIGEQSRGPRGSLVAEVNSLNINDFFTNARLDLAYEHITEKLNYNYGLRSDVYNVFSEFSDNSAYIQVHRKRNDFFFPASGDITNLYGVNNNIESREESLIYAEDRLHYVFSPEFLFTFTGSYSFRNVLRHIRYKSSGTTILFDNNYDSDMNENNLGISGDLEYFGNKLYTKFQLYFSERSEAHNPRDLALYTPAQVRELERIESNKNNSSTRTSLYTEAVYRLSNTNSFRFSGSSSIFRYDTDSKENFDDRDELYLLGSISHTYSNLANFEFTTIFDATLSTLSYLFKERSSNNYKNRIFKITANSLYRPIENLTINNSFQVLANYTVYDFEDIVSQVQSFSFRQMNLRDSIFYDITDNLNINLFTEIKFSEQGQFNDSSFSVKPLTYFDDRSILGKVNFLLLDFMEIFAGYKYFDQKRFDYELGEKKLKNTIRNYGPIAGLNFYLTRNSYINFTGGIDYFRYNDGSLNNSSTSLTLNILWNI